MLLQLSEELRNTGLTITSRCCVRPHEKNVARNEARVYGKQMTQAVKEQTRSNRKHHREADLGNQRIRRIPPAPVIPREPSFKLAAGSVRSCSAGARPNKSEDRTVRPVEKASIRQSGVRSSDIGNALEDMERTRYCAPHQATAIPAAAANDDIRRLSVSSCRISLPRPAPSDLRIANS